MDPDQLASSEARSTLFSIEDVSRLFVLSIAFTDATHTCMFKYKSVHICIESVPYKVLSQLELKDMKI